MRPQDTELAQLLNQFVPVRIVNFRGVDMNRFRFDFDLTFAVLMLNADGHTYSRFGTQDHRSSSDRMSVPGLKRAMREILATHRAGGTPKPAASRSLKVEDYPAFMRRKMARDECYHCHYANNARFDQLREEGKFTKELLFQYPLPENIGVTLEVDRNNVVAAVLPGTPAERAGVKAGDTITRAGSLPVLTSADLQYELNGVPDPGSVKLELERGGKRLPPVTLSLPRGWRRTDISWRASQGGMPPQVGMWAVAVDAAGKRQLGIPPDRLALRVNFFFPGPHWARTRGDLKMNDVIVGINGTALPHMTTRQFHTHFRLAFNIGDTATLDVLRDGQRVAVRVPCMDVPPE